MRNTAGTMERGGWKGDNRRRNFIGSMGENKPTQGDAMEEEWRTQDSRNR